jgi:predicted regulator of Ras-like GTPase activity (Roadblock/LC7/MglB family)
VKDKLEAVLEQARRETRCRSVAVSRRDGLVIVHRLAPAHDPRVTAASAASLVGAAKVTATELEQGGMEQVIIGCTHGQIVAVDAGPEAVMIALYDRDSNLGLALLGLTRAAQQIAKILEQV